MATDHTAAWLAAREAAARLARCEQSGQAHEATTELVTIALFQAGVIDQHDCASFCEGTPRPKSRGVLNGAAAKPWCPLDILSTPTYAESGLRPVDTSRGPLCMFGSVFYLQPFFSADCCDNP